MYKLIIFDLDGTLLDTSIGIIKSVEATLNYFGLPILNNEKLQSFIGPPIQDSLHNHFGLENEELQNASDFFRNEYSQKYLFGAKPYNGIYDLCEYLKMNKILMAIATYKREDYAIRLLKHFNFDKYSNVIFGADNYNILKKEDIIYKCINSVNISNMKDVLMIGDTYYDSIGASKLRIDFIAVTYGYGFRKDDDFSKIHSIKNVDSPNEIIKYLENI
jgi:phosphoglycolate phosphatase